MLALFVRHIFGSRSWLFALFVPLALLLGLWLGSASQQPRITQLQAQHAQQVAQAQQAAAKALQQAQADSDALSAQLAQTLTQTATLQQEKTHALRLATDGRACFDARALGVLNTSPGLSVAGLDRVPTPQPAAAATGAPLATDTDEPAADPPAGGRDLVTTDTDIGAWAIAAGAQHSICRARLDALVSWHERQALHQQAGSTP